MDEYLFYYAGIGSRTITPEEQQLIYKIAKILSEKGGLLFSGNASGSDISWQEGSQGNNVVFLPKHDWNRRSFDFTTRSKDYFVCGNSKEGLESIKHFHPNPNALDEFGRQCMARNYHQVHGYGLLYPRIDFLICCATIIDENTIKGGTNQAYQIAKSLNIPIFNIRKVGWYPKFVSYIKSLLQSKTTTV